MHGFVALFALAVGLASAPAAFAQSIQPQAPCSKLGIPVGTLGQDADPDLSSIDVGRRLFSDPNLSGDRLTSCASCHRPEDGFAGQDAKSRGAFGRITARFSPTITNVGFNHLLLWDGRAASIEEQIKQALREPTEMASSVDHVNEYVKRNSDPHVLNYEDAIRHLASFVRSIQSSNSKFDEFLFGENSNVFSNVEKVGFELFTGKARCGICHVINHASRHSFGGNHALLTDNRFHNLGAHLLFPARSDDLGRYSITKDPEHYQAFKTPTLRDVAKTRRFMHNGLLTSLREVVRFYNEGGRRNDHLDPLIQPLNLTDAEQAALVSFLTTLTGRCNTGGIIE